jgi:acyl carrier protein
MTVENGAALESTVVDVLKDMTQDWDLELPNGIGPTTSLVGDLAFESIDVVQFAVSLEQALGQKGLPFEKLFIKDGDYVDDVEVRQVTEFLRQEMPS